MIDLGAASEGLKALLGEYGLTDWAHKVQVEVWSHRSGEREATCTVSIVQTRRGQPECLIGMGPTFALALGDLRLRLETRTADRLTSFQVRLPE